MKLVAILSGFRSTVDGGIKVTFDLDASQQEAVLSLLKRKDELLVLNIDLVDNVKKEEQS